LLLAALLLRRIKYFVKEVKKLNSEELKIYENNMRYKFCPHCGGKLSLEETNLDIKLSTVFDIHSNFHNPAQHTVGIWFLVEEYQGNIAPGDDIEALGFFSTAEIKEQNIMLAFPTDVRVLDDLVKMGLIL